MFQAMAFKALGIKGGWSYLAMVIIEMFRAQEKVTDKTYNDLLLMKDTKGEMLALDKDTSKVTIGSMKLQIVLDRLRKALSKVMGLETYWPAIKAAVTRAIAANKEAYTVITDALSAAKASLK